MDKIRSQKYTYEFEELDEERIKKNLNIYTKAKENGKINSPATDASEKDDVENEIVTHFETLLNANKIKLDEKLKAWQNKIGSLKLNLDFSGLKSIPKQLDGNFSGIKTSEFSDLKNVYKNYKHCENERANFIKNNNLSRSADYSDSKFVWWAIVLLVFIVEVFLNSNFFAQGHELGLIGGISEAVAISGVNVALGIVIGLFVLTRINLNNYFLKILLSILSITLIVMLFSFNLLSAHYREIFILNPMEEKTFMAMTSFQANPFGLTDFKSWILVIVGCLVSFFSIYKGYSYDDPFPGFGKADRKMRDAENDFWDFKRKIEMQVQDLKEDALKQIKVIQAKIETKSEIYTQSLYANNHSIDAYLVFEKRIEILCDRLLSYYRTTNIEFRETELPKYFNSPSEITSSPTLWENKKITVDEDIKNKYEVLNKNVNMIEDDVINQYKLMISEFKKY